MTAASQPSPRPQGPGVGDARGSPLRSSSHRARLEYAPTNTGSKPRSANAAASGRQRATCPAPISASPSHRNASDRLTAGRAGGAASARTSRVRPDRARRCAPWREGSQPARALGSTSPRAFGAGSPRRGAGCRARSARQVVAREQLPERVRHVALEERDVAAHVRAVHAVADERLRYRRDRAGEQSAGEELPVGGLTEAWVEAAELVEQRPLEQRRRAARDGLGALEQDHVEERARAGLHRGVADRGAGRVVEELELADHEPWARQRCRGGELALELPRCPGVVGVEERDALGRRLGRAAIARGRDAGVGLADQADGRAEAADDVGRRVRRAVVDDDALGDRVRLREHALDRVGDERGAVVHRDDRRDGPVRRGAGFTSPHGAGTPRASAASTACGRCCERPPCARRRCAGARRRRGGGAPATRR